MLISILKLRERCAAFVIVVAVIVPTTPAMAQLREQGAPSLSLPIVGTKVLDAIEAFPQHQFRNLRLSPDGRKLFFWEGVGVANHRQFPVQFSTTGNYAIDVETGTRSPRFEQMRCHRSDRTLQWSAEGSQVGCLIRNEDGSFAWTVWDARAGGAPVSTIGLIGLGRGTTAPFEINSLLWTGSNQLVVAVATTDRLLSAPPTEGRRYTFFQSRDHEAQLKWVRNQAELDAQPGPRVQLYRIGLSTGQAEEITISTPLFAERVYGTLDTDALNRNTSARPVLQRTGDSNRLLVTSTESYLRPERLSVEPRRRDRELLQIYANYEAASSLRGDRSSLFELDLKKSALKPIWLDRPSHIGAAHMDLSSGGTVLVEQNPRSPTNWPSIWGKVMYVAQNSGAHTLTTGANFQTLNKNEDAALFAGSSGGRIFYFNPESADSASGLFEIDVKSKAIERISPQDYRLSNVTTARDGNVVAAVFSSAGRQDAVQVWQSRDRTWRPLTTSPVPTGNDDTDKFFAGIGLATPEHLVWKSRDRRVELDGLLLKPAEMEVGRRYPLIIRVEGLGPAQHGHISNSLSTVLIRSEDFVLASRGYLVLRANHRGTQGMGPEAERLTLGAYGQHEVEFDLGAAVDLLARRGWIDRTKVGIIGHSYGGYPVALALANTRLFAAGVADDPVFSSRAEANNINAAEEERRVPGRHEHSPLISPIWYRKVWGFDPAVQPEQADPNRMRAPLLIRFAANGLNVRQGWRALAAGHTSFPGKNVAENIVNAYERHAIPYEVLIDSSYHSTVGSIYFREWTSRIAQWFDYFLLKRGDNPIPAMEGPPIDQSEMDKLRDPS